MPEASATVRHESGGPRKRPPDSDFADFRAWMQAPPDDPPFAMLATPDFEDEHNPEHPDYLRGTK